MLNLLNKLQLRNGSKMDENEPLTAETPRITRPKTSLGLKYNESVPEKSTGQKSPPKMPAALFFTYSDGKVIPGQEQLYIKGLVSKSKRPMTYEQKRTSTLPSKSSKTRGSTIIS